MFTIITSRASTITTLLTLIVDFIVVTVLAIVSLITSIATSGTALGGGRSFKDRKPIREVGCCESRVAERTLTDGSKGEWSCAFWRGCRGNLNHSCWM